MKRFLNAFLYWFHIRTWVSLVLAISSDRHIKGRENVPRKGAFILTANHMNTADPPLLTEATPRRIAWMTKQELFDIPVFGLWYKWVGFVPVRRKAADLQALRRAQEVLLQGGVLGIFPEGTRSRSQSLGPGEPGVALLALRTGVPILPAAIWGTENVKLPRDLLRRTSIHIRFGKPFVLPRVERITRTAVAEGTDRIMREIAELLPLSYRGVYEQPPVPQAPAASEGKK